MMHRRLMKQTFSLLFLLIAVIIVTANGSGPEIKKVNASDILEKLALGNSVSYKDASIVGDLDLGRLNLTPNNYGNKVIASKISITNSTFENKVNFAGYQFASTVDFSGTTFIGDADFAESDFTGKANFDGAQFLSDADFYSADFADIDCIGATFYKKSNFNSTTFNIYYSSEFDNTRFKGYAGFMAAVFRGYTYFTGTEFDGYANFLRSEFYQETRFDDAKFLGYANFNESRFKDYAYFSGVTFRGPLSLNRTKMPDSDMDWKSVDGHLVYNDAAYLAFLQRLWALGDFQAYDDCYYKYRLLKQSYESSGVGKALDILAWATCGYGVRPQQAFAFGIVLVILFGIISWRVDLPPKLQGSKQTGGKERSWMSALEESMYFSVMMFVTRPPYGLHAIGRWRYLVILEYVSGWLLMALFLVTLARIIIR